MLRGVICKKSTHITPLPVLVGKPAFCWFTFVWAHEHAHEKLIRLP